MSNPCGCGVLVPRVYDLLERCVEEGVVCGWHQAHDHTDTPDMTTVTAAIIDQVMLSLSESFLMPELETL